MKQISTLLFSFLVAFGGFHATNSYAGPRWCKKFNAQRCRGKKRVTNAKKKCWLCSNISKKGFCKPYRKVRPNQCVCPGWTEPSYFTVKAVGKEDHGRFMKCKRRKFPICPPGRWMNRSSCQCPSGMFYRNSGRNRLRCEFRHSARPPKGMHFKLLAYNLYLLRVAKGLVRKPNAKKRKRLLPAAIGPHYDVLALSETHDFKASQMKRYGYRFVVKLGRKRGVSLKISGGVKIASKWPIETQARLFFGKGRGMDKMAWKGVLYARINKRGRRFHVFATHLQAGGSEGKIKTRYRQLRKFAKFVKDIRIPRNEPVLFAGDFNITFDVGPSVSWYGQEYLRMLQTLRARNLPMSRRSVLYSSSQRNQYNKGRKSKVVDYVLYSEVHKRPVWSEFTMFPLKRAGLDLSDHYPVLGHFVFR